MAEQYDHRNNIESYMDHCKEEANNFSLLIRELVEIESDSIDQI